MNTNTNEGVYVSAIRFTATLRKLDAAEKVGSGVIVALPKEASLELPSRGMVMIEGSVNDAHFRAPLEPDGQGSHWFKVDKDMRSVVGIDVGEAATFNIASTKQWPDPEVPDDLQRALQADQEANEMWSKITPMARWDWIRWMDAVVLEKTRKERPEKLCSMLRAGKRRPCCFNRAYRAMPRAAELL